MRRSSVDQVWMVRVSGSGSRENRLLGICLMVSGIVIFRVKIDISECNRHSALGIDCYHWHPLASVLPIIVLDVMFSIKLPDRVQKSNALRAKSPIIPRSPQTYDAYSSSLAILSIIIFVLRQPAGRINLLEFHSTDVSR